MSELLIIQNYDDAARDDTFILLTEIREQVYLIQL